MAFQYFVATDNQATNVGTELWSTDGTPAGTARVSDINLGPNSANPANFVVSGGKVYFTADDGTHGTELWVYDSAANTSTRLDKLPAAGTADYKTVIPSTITVVGNRVLFVATDNQATNVGTELWSTDGTPAGTARVSDINLGPNSANPANFVVSGGKVYFTADDGTHGTELWVYDSAANTSTRLDKLPAAGTADYKTVIPSTITVVGNRVLFVATDNQATNVGTELWSTDGTPAGTARVSDINLGPNSANPANFVVSGGKVYFTADDGTHGTELWVYDSAANTSTRLDKLPAAGTADYKTVIPSTITVVGNRVLFVATDNQATNVGTELWSTDGTPAGTARVSDINLGPNSANPANFVVSGGKVYFTADDGTLGTELWVYDSAANTSTRLDKLPAAGTADYKTVIPSTITVVGNRVLFVATDNQATIVGTELWSTDGTPAGTARVSDINLGPNSANPANFVVSGGKVYFTADDGTHGTELWVYDSAANTSTRLDKLPAAGTADYKTVIPSTITVVGNRVLFVATDNQATNVGTELWSTDGTPAGTARVSDINLGPNSANPANFVVSGGKVYFTADDGTHGTELWVYDSAANTSTRLDKLPAAGTADYRSPVVFATTIYSIAATDAVKLVNGTGQVSFTFKVSRAGNVNTAATVAYTVAGTGTNPATANAFVGNVLPSGTVTFAVGDVAKSININVAGNPTLAQNVDFAVSLALPSGASGGTSGIGFATATAAGTIQTTVATLSIAATNAIQAEGQSGSTAFTFTVTRAGDTTGASSANWAVTGSGASPANATDFTGAALPGATVSFAAGETSKVITVNVAGETAVEPDEGFTVTLSGATGATIATASAVGTILNDDQAIGSLAYVQQLDKGIHRLTPSGASTLTAQQMSSLAVQIDSGTLTRDALKLQFIGDAASRTTAALVAYDWNYGTTPGSEGLDFLTSFTRTLPAQGFSDLNVWVNLAATAATQATTTVTKTYGGLSNDAFIEAAYKDIFGIGPSAQAHSVYLSSMDFYSKYVGQTPGLTAAELAGGTRGCLVGLMLHDAALVVPGTGYANAVSSFYTAVANGNETYGTPLRGA